LMFPPTELKFFQRSQVLQLRVKAAGCLFLSFSLSLSDVVAPLSWTHSFSLDFLYSSTDSLHLLLWMRQWLTLTFFLFCRNCLFSLVVSLEF
jgi:hypothetical protein